ncbi:MAG: hybrid sensor histidine kinase/response regulator [Cyanobacteria bacterium J06597_1]
MLSDPKDARILAVDDSPDNLFLLEKILEPEGYAVTALSAPEQVMDEVRQNPPHLILLDVMMPVMDGYEVTEQLRKDTSLPFIPILLITAHDRADVVRGLNAGADEFIRKPIEMDELLARVRSLLRLKHSIDRQQLMIGQREDFVSRLTHDLRTPLVALDRMIQLFQGDSLKALSDSHQEMLQLMRQSNQNLLQMVNNILDVYKYDAGKEQFTFSPLDLTSLVETVRKELSPLAHEKQLELSVDCDRDSSDRFDEVMSSLVADRMALRRVLTNLVGNAIKFTDKGSVSIGLCITSPPQVSGNGGCNQPWVEVRVCDTGPGIPAEEQQHLFRRFRKGKHRRSGSGLGLHLSHRIVAGHGGSLDVKSEPKNGSCFIVRLPTQQKQ